MEPMKRLFIRILVNQYTIESRKTDKLTGIPITGIPDDSCILFYRSLRACLVLRNPHGHQRRLISYTMTVINTAQKREK
ncbi:hypothetical protein BpHYR1_021878 [Brachionus plicatilis]|uniref:Uncharacterized protein n=1 Tax=Brachionus plicatilis TaxID=10195 RepID=A0A3M7T492_BRAPC|nr:hypothetical protein BpHYR1_021878 [Brachionus plicatilis]